MVKDVTFLKQMYIVYVLAVVEGLTRDTITDTLTRMEQRTKSDWFVEEQFQLPQKLICWDIFVYLHTYWLRMVDYVVFSTPLLPAAAVNSCQLTLSHFTWYDSRDDY